MRDMLPAVDLPLNVLLITPVFLLLFLVLIVWTYRSRGKSIYKDMAELPLETEKIESTKGKDNKRD